VKLPERFAELGPVRPVEGNAKPEAIVELAFWHELGDPLLEGLVEQALAASPDVARATARIRESRALAGVAWAALLPEIGAGAAYERLRLSTESPLLSRFGVAMIPGFIPDANDYKASLTMAYELDLWGKNRRARESALHELEGDIERRRSIGLSLAGELCLAYIDYRTLEARRAISLESLEARKTAHRIARDRALGGLGSDLETTRAEVETASAEAALVDLDRLISLGEHRISVLSASAPGALRDKLAAAHGALSAFQVPAGFPAQILTRRPDLRELSERLWSATAKIGQAKADLFPQIVLQGEIGVEAVDPSKLTRRTAGYWTAGPSLQIPLFDWGRRDELWTAAQERGEIALRDLEAQVLVALQEVEDALASVREDARRRQALSSAAQASRRAAEMARDRYRGGLVSQLELIDAQRTQYQAEDALAEAEGRMLRNAIQLAKALGGGFALADRMMPSVPPMDHP
jgi:multidrug efflux system outer membrane protein